MDRMYRELANPTKVDYCNSNEDGGCLLVSLPQSNYQYIHLGKRELFLVPERIIPQISTAAGGESSPPLGDCYEKQEKSIKWMYENRDLTSGLRESYA